MIVSYYSNARSHNRALQFGLTLGAAGSPRPLAELTGVDDAAAVIVLVHGARGQNKRWNSLEECFWDVKGINLVSLGHDGRRRLDVSLGHCCFCGNVCSLFEWGPKELSRALGARWNLATRVRWELHKRRVEG
jgi:hypothetical protein